MLKDYRFVSVNGNLAGWLHKSLSLDALQPLLDDPDGFLNVPHAKTFKDSPKIKVVKQTLAAPTSLRREIVIKRFSYPSLWRRLSLLLFPPARRNFKAAMLLIEHGIRTAFPLAILDPSGVMARSRSPSYFITEEIEHAQSLDAFWAETILSRPRRETLRERVQVLNEVAALFHCLHSYGIYHGDLKGANILIRKQSDDTWECLVVDVDDVRKRKRLHWSRRIKNLVQLLRTFGQHLNTRERVYLIKRYAELFSLGRDHRRELIGKVFAQSTAERPR